MLRVLEQYKFKYSKIRQSRKVHCLSVICVMVHCVVGKVGNPKIQTDDKMSHCLFGCLFGFFGGRGGLQYICNHKKHKGVCSMSLFHQNPNHFSVRKKFNLT